MRRGPGEKLRWVRIKSDHRFNLALGGRSNQDCREKSYELQGLAPTQSVIGSSVVQASPEQEEDAAYTLAQALQLPTANQI